MDHKIAKLHDYAWISQLRKMDKAHFFMYTNICIYIAYYIINTHTHIIFPSTEGTQSCQ